MLTNQQEMIEVKKTLQWVQKQMKSKEAVWCNVGLPQVSGLYQKTEITSFFRERVLLIIKNAID